MTTEARIIIATMHGVIGPNRALTAAERCTAAFRSTYDDSMSKGTTEAHRLKARMQADKAYELAMPSLDTRANIRAYIACVARGLQLRVFTTKQAQQLLYVAQVALSALPEKRRTK